MGTGLYFAAAMGIANVHTFKTRTPETHQIPHLGVALHGRSFAEREVYENLAAGYPPALPGLFNIGLLHTATRAVAILP
jgi:exonuclease SbcD